jgi:hypothetical protein
MATVHVHRVAVLLEMLVELFLVVNDHFAVTAYGACGHLRKKGR